MPEPSTFRFHRRPFLAGLLATTSLASWRAGAAEAAGGLGDATIRGMAGGSEIVIRTTRRVAGAIDSLRWNGREFIDSHDHGRQLQTAVNLDIAGTLFDETFNPTEAGSEHDGAGPTSSSRLLWLSAAGNELITVTQMAFWLRPDGRSGGHPARNREVLSDYLLQKQVRIGSAGFEHAIRYIVSYTIPPGTAHTRGTFEALTGYMPAAFRNFSGLRADDTLEPLTDGPGEQPLPVVASTRDGSHAMGVWTAMRCRTTGDAAGYGRFWFETAGVAKWNCVFRERAADGERLEPGTYRYPLWIAVGTREQVRSTLAGLRVSGPND